MRGNTDFYSCNEWGTEGVNQLVRPIKKKGQIKRMERCSMFRGGGRSIGALGHCCEGWD